MQQPKMMFRHEIICKSILGALALASTMHASSAQTLQSRQFTKAIFKWAELGAGNYRYKLKVGGVFGAGEYRVEVRGSECKSRHVGGIGLGHARFIERFKSEPTCDGRRIAELLQEVQTNIARGYTVEDLQIDVRYGFPTRAHINTSELTDQGWGFEITDFELLK